ncbi:MAG: dienelactone hydrolase family protein [Thermomicrobiales bacterium]
MGRIEARDAPRDQRRESVDGSVDRPAAVPRPRVRRGLPGRPPVAARHGPPYPPHHRRRRGDGDGPHLARRHPGHPRRLRARGNPDRPDRAAKPHLCPGGRPSRHRRRDHLPGRRRLDDHGLPGPALRRVRRDASGGDGLSHRRRALPVVLVCHEHRGLTDHIRDVARRYAVEGYLACAVDLLSREGGTAAITDPSAIPGTLTDADPMRHVGDFQAALSHYAGQATADVTRVAMTGFCFGGGITWRATTQIAELKAAAPYYGPPPPLDQVPNIQAAVLGVYSDDPDDFANEGQADLQAALDAAGVTYQINIYPDTQHAFHNDTGPRYNEEQALTAWNDTIGWFAQHV